MRVLGDSRERRAHARDPVHFGRGSAEQPGDQAAVGLVGSDEKEYERWLGHGPGADSTSLPKTEQ